MTWRHSGTLHGIQVKAAFFDGDEADAQRDIIARTLPFLRHTSAQLVVTESDRRNFAFGCLVAQPDALYRLGQGRLNLEYKSKSKRAIAEAGWQYELNLGDMLQCLLCGFVIAQNERRPVACVVRYHNAAFFLSPQRAVIEEVWSTVPMACQYYGDERVAAKQLARFAADRVRARFPGPRDPRSRAGRAAHEAMFRR
jgi:hypothetical protein